MKRTNHAERIVAPEQILREIARPEDRFLSLLEVAGVIIFATAEFSDYLRSGDDDLAVTCRLVDHKMFGIRTALQGTDTLTIDAGMDNNTTSRVGNSRRRIDGLERTLRRTVVVVAGVGCRAVDV